MGILGRFQLPRLPPTDSSLIKQSCYEYEASSKLGPGKNEAKDCGSEILGCGAFCGVGSLKCTLPRAAMHGFEDPASGGMQANI